MKKIIRVLMMAMLAICCISTAAFAERMGYDNNRYGRGDYGNNVEIKLHISQNGWVGPYYENDVAGTTGEGKAIEAVSIKMLDGSNISYRVYVRGLGWSQWGRNGEAVGTTGEGKPITAIEIRSSRHNDMEIQIHKARVGWEDWAYVSSGAVGDFNNNIEAIRISSSHSHNHHSHNSHYRRDRRW